MLVHSRGDASSVPVSIGPREIYDHTHGFIGLLAVDGTLLDANRTSLDFIGATLEEVVGQPFWETPWWRDDPASALALEGAVRQAAAGKSARFEGMHTGAEGKTVTFDFMLTPLCDDDGAVVALLPEGHEIDALKEAREALVMREAHYYALVDLASDWYWEQDEHFRFTRFTEDVEFLAGSHVEAHLGKARWELPIAATDDADWVTHRALLERHEPFRNFEFARISDGGDTVWLSASGRPVFDDLTGCIRGYCGTARNITRRKLAEIALADSRRQLAEANALLEVSNAALEARVAERSAALDAEMKRHAATQSALAQTQRVESIGQLAGGVAHDFNNLLAIIGASLELIEPGLSGRDARELLADARSAVESGASLNRRLLTFARKHELEPVRLSINERVRETVRLLERTLGADITLRLKLGPGVHEALVDPAEIDTALVNLAVNARDAMPTGGTLTIETRNYIPDPEDLVAGRDPHPYDFVEIVVTDTGDGMPPDVLEQAIDPFFTTKARGLGTGLGLSSVYGFATQSGGSLAIESRVGEGTVVRLCLPGAMPNVRAGSNRHEKNADDDTSPVVGGNSRCKGELVLVIEDDPAVRRLTLRRLRTLGYETLDAASGPEAIQRLEAGAPIALVFSDVVMPGGMSGHDVARWVRSNRPEIGVLLTSGYNDPGRVGDVRGDSDTVLLGKPYALEELAHRVREALDGRRSGCAGCLDD